MLVSVEGFVFKEEPILVPVKDALRMILNNGSVLYPTTVSAGDKEVALLFRIYSLMKLCFTWVKQDRGHFCLSEMAILSRSRFLITRYVSICSNLLHLI